MSEVDFKIKVSELNINLHSHSISHIMNKILNPQTQLVDLNRFFRLLQDNHDQSLLPK